MANGLLNTSQLTDVGGGKLLRADAARQWLALVAACFAATGVRLTLTEGYRNLARQVFFWLKWVARVPGFNVAAKPGTSNHGLGIAVDMGNYDRAWNWLQLNAHRYGWSWAQGKASGERWHWVYVGGETITTKPAATNATQLLGEIMATPFDLIFDARGTGYVITSAGVSPAITKGQADSCRTVLAALKTNADAKNDTLARVELNVLGEVSNVLKGIR